jgi:5-methylcytosine-specific restriction endonuclease McrA
VAQRRALKKGAAVCDLTRRQWESIKEAYGYRCAYCSKRPKRLTQDHIIPLSKGGNHTESNIVPCCRACNSKKKDKLSYPFQQALFAS